MIAAAGRPGEAVAATLPPANRDATITLIAANAVMAGCEPKAMPYVVAAFEAMARPGFDFPGITTTTSSVFPMLIVNGPSRRDRGIDMEAGCMGGAAGRGSATIGRAIALCLRNIGGQRVGDTSRSVFGQPARSSGLVFAEWEERSPWPSLAERRGFPAHRDVVTVHAGKGTFTLADVNTDGAEELLILIARSIAFPMGNKYLMPSAAPGETFVAINPMWAERFGAAFPRYEDVQALLLEHAWMPAEVWPPEVRAVLEAKGRVDDRGRVAMNERPDQIELVVCGGLGNLHAVALPSWGDSLSQTIAVAHP